MKVRFTAFLTVLALFMSVSAGSAQVQSGDISGRVTDNTGAVLPGVTVTVSGAALIAPMTAVTSETGSYSFPRVPVGTFNVRFELPGFKTLVREGVQVNIGSSVAINSNMEISSVQETVTVAGASPVVDTRSTTQKSTFDLAALQSIPSARDPWVMLERTPAIAMDRINVGGNQSGQQSGYISRGATSTNNKWSLDGVDITDMSATGASPLYYDFDMLQEMSVVTGGADASQQTGGVGINFVTRSGTNMFRGSARVYNTNDRFQADNVTDKIRAAGAGSGAPIQNINDFGFEVGGPVKKDKLWYWGSFGRNDIKVGVVNFYKKTPECRPAGVPTSGIAAALGTTQAIRDCLASDLTTLNNYNWKLTWAPIANNKLNLQNSWGAKVRTARDASDTRPLETAYRQDAVSSTFGQFGWFTGPSPIWKLSDQHVFTDRLLAEVQLAHVGNNFTLTFQEPGQRDIQPIRDLTTGVWGRSFNEFVFLRPTDSVDLTTSYFLPATLGGDHAFKLGYRWRNANGETIAHTGGNAEAYVTCPSGISDPLNPACVPTYAQIYRDGYTDYKLKTQAAYVQDTYTRGRITANLGLRWDRQSDEALATDVPASPVLPNTLPAIAFPGVDSGVVWNDISPRLGLNFDVFGTGRTVARTSYSMYFGQMGPGQLAGNLVAVSQVLVRYGWTDANADRVVQPGELGSTLLAKSAAFDPANPTNFRSPGAVDPDVKNDRTREFILGLDHELMQGVGVSASYIWRKYDQFAFGADRPNYSDSNFTAVTVDPTTLASGPCSTATQDRRCDTFTYFVANTALPTPFTYTNFSNDRYRNYNGLELSLNKRYSNRWMANASFAYNDAKDYFENGAGYEDPTNIANLTGAEYAPESAGSGLDSVFTNAKWLVKASGMYTLPFYDINLAAATQFRQGYPFPQAVTVTNRGNLLGDVNVLLDPLGDVRLDNVFVLDLKVDRAFQMGRLRLIPSVDVFNVTNSNLTQSQRRVQFTYNHGTRVGTNPANANNISSIIAPRVIRFGVRATW
ncbi:MAG: TonB-dependent receptor [Acidobacteriota bacterium]|nr:TonB-dependent receptor [Acidobacteriota bacterium]